MGSSYLYIIYNSQKIQEGGIYRDDGLSIIRSRTGRQADVYRKDITKITPSPSAKYETTVQYEIYCIALGQSNCLELTTPSDKTYYPIVHYFLLLSALFFQKL